MPHLYEAPNGGTLVNRVVMLASYYKDVGHAKYSIGLHCQGAERCGNHLRTLRITSCRINIFRASYMCLPEIFYMYEYQSDP